MDHDLPSYSTAISQDPWPHIAPYIRLSDLPAVARVCNRWNHVFMPLIWGRPSALFGSNEDSLYISLARFKKALQFARVSTRKLTHTLHLPPAHPELYYGPNADWLRTVLERLPDLQSLLVSGLPFFDHRTLENLQSPNTLGTNGVAVSPCYHLRMLDVSGCANATSVGLARLLLRLPGLVYLDLSHTKAAKSSVVLQALNELPHLQVLRLRAVGLQTADIRLLAGIIGKRVRSLDLRDNHDISEAVTELMSQCYVPPTQRMEVIRHNIASSTGEWPSSERTAMLISSLPALNDERHDDYLRSLLTSSFTDSTGDEKYLHTGVSHLKICDRSLNDDTVARVLSSQSLLSLDVDYIRQRSDETDLGFNKTLATLRDCGEGLKYLRINHDVVTRTHVPDKNDQRSNPVHELFAPGPPTNSVELDTAEQTIHELEAAPMFELPASEIRPAELDSTPISSHQLLTPLTSIPTSSPGLVSPLISPISASFLPIPEDSSTQQLTRTYSNVAMRYRAYVDSRPKEITHLHPFMLPGLEILVLTGIPARTADPQLAQRIIAFIEECVTERYWARARADVDYAIPPGRRREEAKELHASSLFALKRIVLEVVEQHQAQRQQHPISKSSVEDPDCETLWTAARDDFSFFHEDTEESGQPESELQPSIRVNSSDKYLVTDRTRAAAGKSAGKQADLPLIDIVGEVAKFRRDARQRYADAVERGRQDSLVGGYWDGEVTVVRQKG